MRFDVYIGVRSAADTVKFYVDELGLFTLEQDYGMNSFMLCARGNRSIAVQIGERDKHPAVFGLRVPDCVQLFARLKQTRLTSGGTIGGELTAWPGMNTFVVHDPSGNCIVLFDEAIAGHDARLDIFLRVKSVSDAIRFYVDELGWFSVAGDLGMGDFLLLSNRNESLALHVSESKGDPAQTPLFAISAKCVDKEFTRMMEAPLVSGATVMPDHAGKFSVLDWPGGKNFGLNDPSSNQVMVYEDRIAPAGD